MIIQTATTRSNLIRSYGAKPEMRADVRIVG